MHVDLRWLDAPADEVAAALASAAPRPRPDWVPTGRQVLLHVNNTVLLWALFVVFFSIGVAVDGYGDGTVGPREATAFWWAVGVFVVWFTLTVALWRWSLQPLATRARLRQGRRELTALVNGFRPEASGHATFASLVTDHSVGVREYPRFVAAGAEFGTVRARAPRARPWQYLLVRLASPLPHLVLDSRRNDGWGAGLPAAVARHQQLSLEGDFDRSFRTFAPDGYGPDALYVLTPDVMGALVDHAADFDVEMRDDTVVFFRQLDADYTRAADWERVDAALTRVVPRLAALSRRYVDERVPGQGAVEISAAAREVATWRPPSPLIGRDGRRLDARTPQTGRLPVIAKITWIVVRTGLYVVPGVFAFAGFMSIVDGR